MCNETKKICNVVAKWAGRTHDARIWNTSNAKKWVERQKDKLTAGTKFIKKVDQTAIIGEYVDPF